jgi:hypothetical protein
MVKIAVAGGSGGNETHSSLTQDPEKIQKTPMLTTLCFTEVAQEVIDALLAAKKHEITILSRTVS